MNFEWDKTKARTNKKKHGVSSKGTPLVVSYTERSGTIRIISARRMIRQERKAYEG